jgi:hypothetical protein
MNKESPKCEGRKKDLSLIWISLASPLHVRGYNEQKGGGMAYNETGRKGEAEIEIVKKMAKKSEKSHISRPEVFL